VVTAENSALN